MRQPSFITAYRIHRGAARKIVGVHYGLLESDVVVGGALGTLIGIVRTSAQRLAKASRRIHWNRVGLSTVVMTLTSLRR